MATKRPKLFRAIGACALVVALLAAGYFYFLKRKPGGAAPQAAHGAASVGVDRVARGSAPVDIEAIGVVQALNTVAVKSRVDGQIEQVLFKEGQAVKAGDLLVKLDGRPFQSALDQALAKKSQDEATLNNARLDLQRYSNQSF